MTTMQQAARQRAGLGTRLARLLGATLGALLCALATAAPPAPAPATFEIGGLQVIRQGDGGRALILVPGLASGAWAWEDLATSLQPAQRVYRLTLPGFDGRPPLPGDGLARAGEAIAALIAQEGLDHPVLVGHSLGGTLALRYAAEHPGQLGGVVTLDGLPVFPMTEGLPPAQRAAMSDRIRSSLATEPAAFAAQQLQYMRTIGVVDPALAERLAAWTARSDPAATADHAARVMALDLRPQMPAIDVPVLALSPYLAADYAPRGIGEKDKADYYAGLLAGIPRLQVVSIPGARHFAMFDQPQAVRDAVRTFVASLK